MPQVIDIPGVGQVEFPDSMSDNDITAASKNLHLGYLKESHAKNLAAGIEAEKQVSNVENIGRMLGAGTRVAGMLGGGPVGAMAAEPAAEMIEKASSRAPQQNLDPTAGTFIRAGISGGLGAVPGQVSKFIRPATTLGRVGMGAATGGALGAAQSTAIPLTEGRLPNLNEVATGAGVGTVLGAAGGFTNPKGLRGRPTNAEQEERAINEMHTALGAKTAEQKAAIAEAHPAIHHELINRKTGADFSKLSPEGNTKGYLEGAQEAKRSLGRETWEPDLAKFGKQVKPMQSVADRIRGSVSEGTKEIEKTTGATVENLANKYDGKNWSLNKIYERQKELSRTLDNIKKSATGGAELEKPINKARLTELQSLNDTLYDELSALSGKDYTHARFRYKALSEVEDLAKAAHDKAITAAAQKEAVPPSLVSDIVQTKGVTPGVIKHGQRMVQNWRGDPNDPNILITKALTRLGGTSKRPDIRSARPTLTNEPELVRTSRESIPPPPEQP